MKTEIQTQINVAMKAHDEIRLNVLREIKSKITLAEKEGKTDFISIFKSMAKARKQSIEAFVGAGKKELAEKEKQELIIIEEYLPKSMTEEEIIQALNEIIIKNNIPKNPKSMGILMKEFNTRYSGQDGKLVSTIIKDALT